MTVTTAVEANGRDYAAPKVPAIAICLDGCEPSYLDAAIADGLMPTLERMRKEGTDRLADSVIPSFTNPNNLSIATGRPPVVHGICGNFLYDPETGEEVMMNDVRFLRAPTVFKQFYDAGAKVAIVTAKDKLRALLGAGLSFDEDRARCFSAEQSASSTAQEHGIDNASDWLGMPQPEVYSADLSEFVFAAGVKLLREWKPGRHVSDDNRLRSAQICARTARGEVVLCHVRQIPGRPRCPGCGDRCHRRPWHETGNIWPTDRRRLSICRT